MRGLVSRHAVGRVHSRALSGMVDSFGGRLDDIPGGQEEHELKGDVYSPIRMRCKDFDVEVLPVSPIFTRRARYASLKSSGRLLVVLMPRDKDGEQSFQERVALKRQISLSIYDGVKFLKDENFVAVYDKTKSGGDKVAFAWEAASRRLSIKINDGAPFSDTIAENHLDLLRYSLKGSLPALMGWTTALQKPLIEHKESPSTPW